MGSAVTDEFAIGTEHELIAERKFRQGKSRLGFEPVFTHDDVSGGKAAFFFVLEDGEEAVIVPGEKWRVRVTDVNRHARKRTQDNRNIVVVRAKLLTRVEEAVRPYYDPTLKAIVREVKSGEVVVYRDTTPAIRHENATYRLPTREVATCTEIVTSQKTFYAGAVAVTEEAYLRSLIKRYGKDFSSDAALRLVGNLKSAPEALVEALAERQKLTGGDLFLTV